MTTWPIQIRIAALVSMMAPQMASAAGSESLGKVSDLGMVAKLAMPRPRAEPWAQAQGFLIGA
jgi:hypothetical protein